MIRQLFIAGIIFMLSGCITPHIPSTHFTPIFTQSGQADAEVSAGLSSYNLNTGYSPVKHLALLGNVQSFSSNTSDNNQRSAEGAIGFYHQAGNIYFGLNAGYGQGTYSTKVSTADDTGHGGIYNFWDVTKGSFNKYTGQAYISFLSDPEDNQVQLGLSFKFNYYLDNYIHSLNLTVPAQSSVYSSPSPFKPWPEITENLKTTNISAELCFFSKFYISRNFYTDFQLGFRPGNDDFTYTSSMKERRFIFRVGLGLNISILRKSKKS